MCISIGLRVMNLLGEDVEILDLSRPDQETTEEWERLEMIEDADQEIIDMLLEERGRETTMSSSGITTREIHELISVKQTTLSWEVVDERAKRIHRRGESFNSARLRAVQELSHV